MPRSWSLRTRLLITQIALLAVVCAGIGVATEFALQRFLMHQLDNQLIDAGRRSAAIFDLPPPPDRRRRDIRAGSGSIPRSVRDRDSSTRRARPPARSARWCTTECRSTPA